MKKRFVILLVLTLAVVFVFSACEPDFVGNKIKRGNEYSLSFSVLNRTEKETLSLKKGQELNVSLTLEKGTVSLRIGRKDKPAIYTGTDLESADFAVVVPENGRYIISVSGKGAKGKAEFDAVG